MRAACVCFLAAACGSVEPGKLADAPAAIDAIELDAPPACTPRQLLVGGMAVAPQGWSIAMLPPATLSYVDDDTKLVTSTAMSGGQLLVYYPGAFEAGKPLEVQIVMMVEAVDAHNPLDAAAAILGSFTPPFGAGAREQMIYLDAGKVGWADDTQAFSAAITNGAYHTFDLSVDAAGAARLTVDGVVALTRTGFTTNGTLALGDQTNDVGVDATLRLRSVTRLCP